MSFKAQIKASLGWDWNEGLRDNARLEYVKGLLTGSGQNQADAVWHTADVTLSLGASQTLDLIAMVRTILGTNHALTFTAIKALLVVNQSTDGGELLVGGAVEDPWAEPFASETDRVVVPADSVLLLINRQYGWPVDAAARNLLLTASGGDVTYSMALIGTITPGGSSSGSGE